MITPNKGMRSARRIPDPVMDFAELMQRSELILADAASNGAPNDKLFARRLIEDVSNYRRWETQHGSLMRVVAAQSRLQPQIHILKKVALSMVHRKAPFEYLKDRHITGPARHRLISVLYGKRDYADSLVREHLAYLMSAASYLCAGYLLGTSLQSPGFDESVALYQHQYNEYFCAQWQCLLADRDDDEDTEGVRALLPLLKYELQDARTQILTPRSSRPGSPTLEELRRRTGDTVKIRTLRLVK